MVKGMKRYVLLISLFFLSFFIKSDIKPVFNEIDNKNYYEVIFKSNISTNNFNDYFINTEVIWLKPKINNLYKDKIKYKYYFKNLNNLKNIESFKLDYIKYLESIKLYNLKTNIISSGIMIDKIKISATEKEIIELKNNLKNIDIVSVY